MNLGMIQEMCETTLLYLGNNLYATLRRHPFSLERPIPFDLEDIQTMRQLEYDINERYMYFEMRIGSDYETLVQNEEVMPVPDIKLFASTGLPIQPKSVLDKDYLPSGITIKQEPGMQGIPSHRVIGQIIDQPDDVAKLIKQELIDSTVKDIAEKHSASCALNVFVQEHGGASGLGIEDIQSLIQSPSSHTRI